jgi:carboxylate-amine ligase
MRKNISESIRKHFKIGGEIELFIINNEGYMVSAAPELIAAVKNEYPKIAIVKECGMNMIELGAPPDISTPNVLAKFVNDLQIVMDIAEKMDVYLYPYSTYPGKFTPKFNKDQSYLAKEKIFGSERWKIAAECVGHHCHYTLPWGVFDEESKSLKPLINSKHKQSLVNIYNMAIAMDPVLSVFAQSSPFYRGKYMGKDSRVIVYRGGRALKYKKGLYSDLQKFGALQQYKHTGTDLIHTIKNKNRHWLNIVKKYSPENYAYMAKNASVLATSWNPVKVNPHGTIELRGMDMNFPSILVAIDLVVQYIGKMIQEDFVQIVPSDIGLVMPFKREKNVIYIPPYSHVRLHLQYLSAYKGLEDDDVYEYATALFRLAKKGIPKQMYPLLLPIENMLNKRKTTSDNILERVRKRGWAKDDALTNAQAAELALEFSRDFRQDLAKTHEVLKTFKSK